MATKIKTTAKFEESGESFTNGHFQIRMTEKVQNFIYSTVCSFYAIPKTKELQTKVQTSVDEFIHNPHYLILQTEPSEEDTVHFHYEVQPLKNSIIFFKSDVALDKDEVHLNQIGVVIVSDTAAEALYNNLKHVYAPLLLSDNLLVDSGLQESMSQLEIGLKDITLRRNGNSDSIRAILSIDDEISYWKIRTENASRKEREAAANFISVLEQINEEIAGFHSAVLADILENAENIGGLLDDLWRYTASFYPQARMVRLFDIIGNQIVTRLQEILSESQVWETLDQTKCNEALTVISGCVAIINIWISACKSLTELYWPNQALHSWTGNVHVPNHCKNFQIRLKQIEEIRAVYNQLMKLLSASEKVELDTVSLFEPFKKINVWVCSSLTNQQWNKAVMYFTNAVKPAETKVADKIKSRLRNSSIKQTLYEFVRYQTLIERPTFKFALREELESFVMSLGGVLKDIQEQIDSEDAFNDRNFRATEISPVVHQVQWAKHMEEKVKQIEKILSILSNDFDGTTDLHRIAVKLQVELKNYYTLCYDEWCRNLQAQLKNGNLELAEEESVVEFSKTNNLMRVNFNPSLIMVESEIRHMSACGLPPPALPALKRATDALHYARQLQRVSSFHNTSGSRLVSCLRPMLLPAALRLDSIAATRVAWRDTNRVDEHVRALSDAAADFHQKNTYLMKQHMNIKQIVMSLMGKDLLVQQADWKKGFRDIRDIIEKTEKEGFNESGGWRKHWDAQLREVLRVQYLETLTQIHKRMLQTHVHLQARGENLVFVPPMEEIRTQQYRTLKRLISLPEQFSTLQGVGSFASIIIQCSGASDTASAIVESTLGRAEDRRLGWRRKIGLALFPNGWQSPRRVEPDDFMRDYRACRVYARTVAEMSFEDEKVEWLVISVGSLRREMDSAVRSLWSTLVSSLRNSCLDDIASLEEFLLKTKNISSNQVSTPNNAQELVELSAAFNELVEKTPEMQKLTDRLKTKQSMLRNWGGDPLGDGPFNAWQVWLDTMRSQEKLFQHQTERVQRWLASEWDRLTSAVESWKRRQNHRISRPPTLNCYDDIKSLHAEVLKANEEWNSLKEEKDKLYAESVKFNMTLEMSEEWIFAEQIYEQENSTWKTFSEFDQEFSSFREQVWLTFHKKLNTLDEFVAKWESKLVPNSSIELFLQNHVQHYKDLTPTLKYLRNTDLTERHWAEIISLLEIEEVKSVEDLRVGHLLDVSANIKKHIKIIQKLSASASGEALVAQSIQELELWFAAARLPVTYCKDRHGKRVPIVADFNILTKIEEQSWRAESLGSGAGGAALTAWAARCRSAARLAVCLHRAQRRWLYLEPILAGDNGDLGRKFRAVDQGFRQVALTVDSDSRLAALLRSPRLQATLDSLLEQLASCQTALNDYINEKREVFPRFYFLSDDDLLEILGQARAGSEGREVIIQTHLTKLFPGATSVLLGKDAMSITALVSHGEEFVLQKAVGIDCAVEVWLKNLEDEMRQTMKACLNKCLSVNDQDKFSLPTQILMLAQNIRFTEETEKAVVRRDLRNVRENFRKECDSYISLNTDDGESEGDKNKRQALALQCIHYINILNNLIENNVTSSTSWLWQKQLRFYYTQEKAVVSKMGAAQMAYTYEYLGVNFGQFVRTETAETCFFILTQALHLGLIGNPFGPAGTGKTESVKALGGLLGRLVLVFNCDEAMDEACIRRIVKGLELCGAWGCLDEFNRLSEESMATLAAVYSDAMKTTGAVICTMNPAGGAYGGRRTVTAHSALLRPVAAAHASPLQLAVATLQARGIDNAEKMAEGLASVLSLASEVLTDREHYDWGVRTLKPLLCTSNPAKALRTNALSKLTAFDAQGFNAILKLIFPNESFDENIEDELDKALRQSYVDLNLKYNERQVRKCKEVYEHLKHHMGIAIIGPPGSGKTTIRKLLKNALTMMGWNIVEHAVCPMAMSRQLLLGYMEHDTRQWRDGVISTIAQNIASQPEISSWLVLDGEPEPKWAEALNSVLDDNRLLTLGAGWRVHFPPLSRLILEAPHLQAASPATVSRLAITLLDTQDSCPIEMMEVWFGKQESSPAIRLLRETTQAVLDWLHTNRAIQTLEPVAIVRQIIIQFSGLDVDDIEVNTDEARVSRSIVTALYSLIKPKLQLDFLNQVETWTGQRRYSNQDPSGVKSALKLQQHIVILVSNDTSLKSQIQDLTRECDENTVLQVKCTPVLEPHHLTRLLKLHGATSGTAVTLVAENVDRVRKDSSGIAPLHDFLLQLIQYGGFWEGEGAEGARWTSTRVRLLLCSPPSRLPARLLNLLAVYHSSHFNDENEDYQRFVLPLLEENIAKACKDLDLIKVSNLMVDFYKQISQFSSLCSTNDLLRWAKSLKNYSSLNLLAIANEAQCIFGDRLSSKDEKTRFVSVMRNVFKTDYKVCFAPKILNDSIVLEERKAEDWSNVLQRTIDQCETENDIIFGDDGAEISSEFELVCNAIMKTLLGSMCTVIVDSDGTGTRAARAVCAELLTARCHTAQTWNNIAPLAQALVSAGTEDKRTLLLCEESANISRERNILGYLEAILQGQIYQLEDQSISHQNVNSHDFWKCVKRNLGIIVLLDSGNPNIEELFEDYPMLYEKCHTLRLDGWSKNTLESAPEKIINRLKRKEGTASDSKMKSLPIDGFLGIYSSLKSFQTRTPYKYMIFVKSFYFIRERKGSILHGRKKTLTAGLQSLNKAKCQVDELKKDAAVQEAALSQKQKKANAALEQISSTVTSATEHREEMEKLKITIQRENEQLQKEAAVIEAELAEAEPGLKKARAAVADIKPESLTEIRSLRAPPDTVRDVLEGVLLLMDVKDTSWHSMKTFLSKRGIKEDIRNLDVSTVPASAITAAESLMAARPTSFLPATVRRASAAAAPLAAWLHSALQYARAHTRLSPLRSRQAALKRNLKQAEAQLENLTGGLQTADERVATLKEKLNRYTKEGMEIEFKLKAAKETIIKAEALVHILEGESSTWEEDLESLSKEMAELDVRSLLSAAYINYHEEENLHSGKLIDHWCDLLGYDHKGFSLVSFLSSTEVQLEWIANGLPNEETCIRNALIISQFLKESKCGSTPLILDPDEAALNWLRNTYPQFDLISQHSEVLYTALLHATRFGKTLIITEVTHIDESWAPLIRGLLPNGFSAINPNFRLLLHSKDVTLTQSIHSYQRCILSVVRFTPTYLGIVDKLIDHAIKQVNPELNENLERLKKQMAALEKERHVSQELLSEALSKEPDLLHDSSTAAILKENAARAIEVKKAAKEASTTSTIADGVRSVLSESAGRATKGLLAALKLERFLPLPTSDLAIIYGLAISHALKPGKGLEQINSAEVTKPLTEELIGRILLCVPKNEKHAVAIHVLRHMYSEDFPDALWDIMVGNSADIEGSDIQQLKTELPWIEDDCLPRLIKLKKTLPDVYKKLRLNETKMWNEIKDSDDSKALNVFNLGPFEKLVIAQCLVAGVVNEVSKQLVEFYTGSMRGVILRGVGAHMRRAICARGHAGAHAMLTAVAPHPPHTVHLQDTTTVDLKKAVDVNSMSGRWLLVLVGTAKCDPASMALLTDQKNFTNDQFRLWIVFEDREVPPYVANACVNVLLEPPSGVKNNVLQTLTAWEKDDNGEVEKVRRLFSLALLHAMVQERRNYIPEGWSRWYAWEWSDVVAARGAGAQAALPLYAARVLHPPDLRTLEALYTFCVRTPPPKNSFTDYARWVSEKEPNAAPAGWRHTTNLSRVLIEIANAPSGEIKDMVSVKKSLVSILSMWKRLNSENAVLLKGEIDFEKIVNTRKWCWGEAVLACESRGALLATRLHSHLARAHFAPHAAQARELAADKVPKDWHQMWPGPDSAIQYIKEVSFRATNLMRSVSQKNIRDEDFTEVDLRSLFYPRKFLAVLKCQTADSLKCSPDSLELETNWNDIKQERGWCVCTGCRLWGGEWRSGKIRPGRVSNTSPQFALRYRHQVNESKSKEEWKKIPLYTSSGRHELVSMLPAPIDDVFDEVTWVLNATALYIAEVAF